MELIDSVDSFTFLGILTCISFAVCAAVIGVWNMHRNRRTITVHVPPIVKLHIPMPVLMSPQEQEARSFFGDEYVELLNRRRASRLRIMGSGE